jgi:hypothetical protein
LLSPFVSGHSEAGIMFLFSSDGSGFESAGAVGELAFGDLSDHDGFERGKILNLPGVENGRLEIRSAESFKKGRNHEKKGAHSRRAYRKSHPGAVCAPLHHEQFRLPLFKHLSSRADSRYFDSDSDQFLFRSVPDGLFGRPREARHVSWVLQLSSPESSARELFACPSRTLARPA